MRVSNADLTHEDGPAPPTHVTGGGRVTIGDAFLTYDLALQAAPLSLTTLARSYPALAARGTLTFRGERYEITRAFVDLPARADANLLYALAGTTHDCCR